MAVKRSLKFVDLFAGIGGFHVGLSRLGHECVFASELDPDLREIYVRNFPEMAGKVYGDIREYKSKIPAHDILCAGFPCQPFSKSGEQLGINDKTRGTLFHELLEILKHRKPQYFIFENVGNFERHDGGNTWKVVKTSLVELGYDVRGTEHVTPPPRNDWRDRVRDKPKTGLSEVDMMLAAARATARDKAHGLISPHHLGYPQTRERFFIVGSLNQLPLTPFPVADRTRATSLSGVLQTMEELSPEERAQTKMTSQQVDCIEHWNVLLKAIPASIELPSFPIWGDEIDAKYPYEKRTPWATPPRELGKRISGNRFPLWTRKSELLAALPSYAREEHKRFRDWKIHYIRQNRDWFKAIKPYMPAGWVGKLSIFPPSLRKLEWNVKGGERDLWRHVLQFRPSGLRARRYDRSPALVAMTATQIPILGPKGRFMSRIEGLRIQGFPDGHALPLSRSAAFAALGNAVHVGVVEEIAARLLEQHTTPNSIDNRTAALA
jgi:DNA (cytosine-5)-methyltransferase 1